MRKNFNLVEVVVVVSIMAIVGTILSSIAFGALSMKTTGEHEVAIGNFFKKEKSNLDELLQNALVICSYDAREIDGDAASICSTKDSLTKLDSSKKLYVKSKENEDYILEFKNSQLFMTNQKTNEDKILAKKVEGSFSYKEKNLYEMKIEFLDEKKNASQNQYPLFFKIPKE